MTDYKAMIEEHSCKPNQGCGVMTICMCGVAEDMADEIERLRETLRHYVSECDCNGGTFIWHDDITGKDLVRDCPKCEPARAALGEKE